MKSELTNLSYEEAVAALHAAIPTARARATESVAVSESLGRVIAKPIRASVANPKFDNSAVDGYALPEGAQLHRGTEFEIIGSSKAGSQPQLFRGPSTAIRILTGAPIPVGTHTVVMQESVDVEAGRISLLVDVEGNAHIRRAGTDYEEGAVLVSAGTRLRPGDIGAIASQGLESVTVFPRLRVSILVTGDEIVRPPTPVEHYQMFDSNGPMLSALLQHERCEIVANDRVPDRLESVKDALEHASATSDIVIVSGGASVGDYDFVAKAASSLGKVLFNGVRVRPGKPVLAAIVREAIVLGLPGNPASAFVCFHIFAREALHRLSGASGPANHWIEVNYAPSTTPANRDDFVRCKLDGYPSLSATRIHEQGSFGLLSLGTADCLVRVSHGCTEPGRYAALFPLA